MSVVQALPSSQSAVVAQGTLWGGNLSLVAHLVGTPYLPDIVAAIYRAFSLATANTFVFGVVAAVVAGGAVALLREAPMRAPAPQTSRGSGALAEPGE